jgi:hypothetical protein
MLDIIIILNFKNHSGKPGKHAQLIENLSVPDYLSPNTSNKTFQTSAF